MRGSGSRTAAKSNNLVGRSVAQRLRYRGLGPHVPRGNCGQAGRRRLSKKLLVTRAAVLSLVGGHVSASPYPK